MTDSKKKWQEFFGTLPSLLWLTVFFVIPTFIVLKFAFHAKSPDGGVAPGLTLETWRTISNPNYPEIIWRTVWISAVTTLICVLLSLPCA